MERILFIILAKIHDVNVDISVVYSEAANIHRDSPPIISSGLASFIAKVQWECKIKTHTQTSSGIFVLALCRYWTASVLSKYLPRKCWTACTLIALVDSVMQSCESQMHVGVLLWMPRFHNIWHNEPCCLPSSPCGHGNRKLAGSLRWSCLVKEQSMRWHSHPWDSEGGRARWQRWAETLYCFETWVWLLALSTGFSKNHFPAPHWDLHQPNITCCLDVLMKARPDVVTSVWSAQHLLWDSAQR